jgi:ribonuclease BN (tRNA processing enzyme)
MEVTFIGTSDAFGAGGRRQSAILVRSGQGTVLMDCGTTTGTGLAALGIAREEIDAILISHFHADHFGGIPLLLLGALYEDERRRPLIVAGPPDVEARVRRAADALGHAIEKQEWSFPIEFRELRAGEEKEVGPAQVGAFPTHHQPDSHPHGLTLTLDSRRLAYSGDTGWFQELPRRTRGSDLFICECTFVNCDFEYHLSYDVLLTRLREFDCGRMLITHLGEEMSARRGRLELETADDGMVVRL